MPMYVVRCYEDGRFCLLLQKEFVYDAKRPDIEIGQDRKFWWENEVTHELVEFTGLVLEKSGKKSYIVRFNSLGSKKSNKIN